MLPGQNLDVCAHVGPLAATVAVEEEAGLQLVAALTGEEGHGHELEALRGPGLRQLGLEVLDLPHEDAVEGGVGPLQLIGQLADVGLLLVD